MWRIIYRNINRMIRFHKFLDLDWSITGRGIRERGWAKGVSGPMPFEYSIRIAILVLSGLVSLLLIESGTTSFT